MSHAMLRGDNRIGSTWAPCQHASTQCDEPPMCPCMTNRLGRPGPPGPCSTSALSAMAVASLRPECCPASQDALRWHGQCERRTGGRDIPFKPPPPKKVTEVTRLPYAHLVLKRAVGEQARGGSLKVPTRGGAVVEHKTDLGEQQLGLRHCQQQRERLCKPGSLGGDLDRLEAPRTGTETTSPDQNPTGMGTEQRRAHGMHGGWVVRG